MTPGLRDPQGGDTAEIATSTGGVIKLPSPSVAMVGPGIGSNTGGGRSRQTSPVPTEGLGREDEGSPTETSSESTDSNPPGRGATTTTTPPEDSPPDGVSGQHAAAREALAAMLGRCRLHRTASHSSNNNNNKNTHNNDHHHHTYREKFPVACLPLLHDLPGNRHCLDCHARDPEWAAICYGALVCIKCSGRHRSLGVAVSRVRSVPMDHWTHSEVVAMLEGGNAQLKGFFERHALTEDSFGKRQQQQQQQQQQPHRSKQPTPQRPSALNADNLTTLRYKTRAALFYKSQLEAHVVRLLEDPEGKPYKGRSRRPASNSSSRRSSGPRSVSQRRSGSESE